MSKATHTVWRAGFRNIEVMETDEHVAAAIRVTCGNADFTKRISRIIAEAGNAHEQTGMTPRQLVEQREMLIEALKIAVRQNEFDMQMTGEELRSARAALAATEVKK